MGPEQKALWQITFKYGYRISNLYFHCEEEQIQFMFNQIARKDFKQPVELMYYDLLGEIMDYEEYKPVKIIK